MSEMNEKLEGPQEQPSDRPPLREAPPEQFQEITKESQFPGWTRLSDRNKAPRRWWWPPKTDVELTPDVLKRQHDECSKTIRRTLFILIGFSFFCLLTLGASDAPLLGAGAEVDVPFADVRISIVAFLIIGPIVLIGLTTYLHIFVGRWLEYDSLPTHQKLPAIFNFDDRVSSLLSGLLFYWLVPVVLAVFTWKGGPRPEAPVLGFGTAIVTAALVWVQIRRCPEDKRRRRNPVLWTVLAGLVAISTLTVMGEIQYTRPLYLFKASLKGKDLRGFRLIHAYMVEADLSSANLQGVQLNFANLHGANLSETILSEANLRGAKLHGADLSEANLRGAKLIQADLRGAKLINADLRGADLVLAKLQAADLGGAKLQRADLRGAQLHGADLRGAQLHGVGLAFAQLQGADLQGAQLQDADLRVAQLQGAKLQGVGLQRAGLAFARLQGAKLRRAKLRGADLRGARIGGASFDRTDLNLTDLRQLDRDPLTNEEYDELENRLTDALSNEPLRASIVADLKAAVGKPDNIERVQRTKDALCGEDLPFEACLTEHEIERYKARLAQLLARFACDDADGARRMVVSARLDHTLLAALAGALNELDCALPKDVKAKLRKIPSHAMHRVPRFCWKDRIPGPPVRYDEKVRVTPQVAMEGRDLGARWVPLRIAGIEETDESLNLVTVLVAASDEALTWCSFWIPPTGLDRSRMFRFRVGTLRGPRIWSSPFQAQD